MKVLEALTYTTPITHFQKREILPKSSADKDIKLG